MAAAPGWLRTFAISLGLLLIATMSSVLIVGAQAQSLFNLNAGRCLTDGEVPSNERDAYEEPALRFVKTLIGDKPEEAYSEFSDQLRAKLSAEDFARNINQRVRPILPLADLHIEHSYRESQVSFGSGRINVLCTAIANGDVNVPDGRVTIAALPISLQAHVIVEGRAKNNVWSFILWLLSDPSQWQIAGFYIQPVTIQDKTATDVWNLARKEQQHGHALNSYLLYASAAQLAYRGPDLQLGIQPEIEKEMSALSVPPELSGKPPFQWKFGNDTYQIVNIGPIGVGTAFDLRIAHRVEQTGDDQALEQQNQALIRGFESAHPDYAEVFDGLIVQAVRPNGSGFGTVDQKRGER